MYDEATDSRWSQLLAAAIRGPQTGTELTLRPGTTTSWRAWQESHPDTVVLLPSPRSNTVRGRVELAYDIDAYAGYDQSEFIGVTNPEFEDDRLHPKARVIGVVDGTTARAYPRQVVADAGPITDTVGETPVVVTLDDAGTLVAYDRRVTGRTLSFDTTADGTLRAGGSRWDSTTGDALDGPHEGTQLSRANDASPMFWFAWLDFNPETDVYRA